MILDSSLNPIEEIAILRAAVPLLTTVQYFEPKYFFKLSTRLTAILIAST